jgi:hypothetical protein
MPVTTIFFLAMTSVIGLGALARGLLLGAEGRTTKGLSYALTGYLTLFLVAVCAVHWTGSTSP